MKITTFFFVYTLIFVASSQNILPTSLDSFASALKNVSLQASKKQQEQELKEHIKQQQELQKQQDEFKKKENELKKQKVSLDEDLLGSWMLKHHPKKLIAYDKSKNIYQINVFKQFKGDCWMQSLRNCLYIMDLIFSPRKEFNKIYKNMIDREQYIDFTKEGCISKKAIIKKLNKDIFSCKPNCTPAESATYLKKIVILEYKAGFKSDTQDVLQKRENNKVSDQATRDYTAFSDPFNLQSTNLTRIVTLFHGLRTNKNDVVGFNIGIESINHDITLVVHKHNDTFEYLFSDSNNVSFTGNNKTTINEKGETIYYTMSDKEYDQWKTTFSDAINQVIFFVKNPDKFDDAIVRLLYQELMDSRFSSDNFKYSNFIDMVEEVYGKISSYNLLNNKLYQEIYKNLFESRVIELLYGSMLTQYDAVKKLNSKHWGHFPDTSVEYLKRFYGNLQDFKLLDSEIYTSIYKSKYCNFIQQEQNLHKQKTYHHNLLKKISC